MSQVKNAGTSRPTPTPAPRQLAIQIEQRRSQQELAPEVPTEQRKPGDISADEVIDTENSFIFPHLYTTHYLPGGIYRPGTDDQGRFHLVKHKSSNLNKKARVVSVESVSIAEETYEEPTLHIVPPVQEEITTLAEAAREGTFQFFPMHRYNPGLKEADHALSTFLTQRDQYKEGGLEWRSSLMLFGPPGTGKTFYIEHICYRAITEYDAVVLRVENEHELTALAHIGLPVLANRLDTRFKVIVIEELRDFVRVDDYRIQIMHMLESTFLRHNILFLITTNHPEDIPMSMIDRPSRINYLVDVPAGDHTIEFIQHWYKYLINQEMPNVSDVDMKDMQGWSIDYLKDIFIYSYTNKVEISAAVARVRARKSMIKANFSKRTEPVGFGNIHREYQTTVNPNDTWKSR